LETNLRSNSTPFTGALVGMQIAIGVCLLEVAAGRILSIWIGDFYLDVNNLIYATIFAMILGAFAGALGGLVSMTNVVLATLGLFAVVRSAFWLKRIYGAFMNVTTFKNPMTYIAGVLAAVALIVLIVYLRKRRGGKNAFFIVILFLAIIVGLTTLSPVITEDIVVGKYIYKESIKNDSSIPKVAKPKGKLNCNVLIILVDTLRADALGCYGYPRNTSPWIDSLAKEGVLFEKATADSSWTRPSVGSLLTGLPSRLHGFIDSHNLLNASLITLPEIFSAAGARTFAVITNRILKSYYGLGQGFDQFMDRTDVTDTSWFMTGAIFPRMFNMIELKKQPFYDGVHAIDRTLEYLPSGPDQKPFFGYVHLMEPHYPYGPPKRHARMFLASDEKPIKKLQVIELERAKMSALSDPKQVMEYRRHYDVQIFNADEQIGRLLKELDKRKIAKNTLIVIVSDHGEAFMEHGNMLHGFGLYEEEVHVPLIMRLPGKLPAGIRNSDFVTLSEVGAAIMSIAGIEPPQEFPHNSFWPPKTKSDEVVPRPIFMEVNAEFKHPSSVIQEMNLNLPGRWSKLLGVKVGDYKFLLDKITGQKQLFDLTVDPGEQHNLLTDKPNLAARLDFILSTYDNNAKPLTPASKVTGALSELSKQALRSLGYIK